MTLAYLTGSAAGTIAAGALPLAAAVAVLAGLLSFASPCVLPLVPGFLGYVTGLSDVALERRGRGRMLLGAALFVLGFTVVFLVLTVLLAQVGLALAEHRGVLMRVGGVLVMLMALVFLGVGSQRELRSHLRPAAGLAGAPLLGAVFGLGWAPCTGPTLGAVLTLASTSTGGGGAVTRGVVLATAYSLGLGLPFLLVAGGYERFGATSGWLRRHQRGIQLFGGGLLLLVGALLATGVWEQLTGWLQSHLVNGFETVI